jgi:hypothetical protein
MLNTLRPAPKKIGNTFKISVRMLHPTMFSTTTPKCNKPTTPKRKLTPRRKKTPPRRKSTTKRSKRKLDSPRKKKHLKK